MSIDAFLMRFESEELVGVQFELVKSVFERFGTVNIAGASVVVTFPDGEISDQIFFEIQEDGTISEICLPRAALDERYRQFTFAMMTEGKMCLFDETLDAIFAITDVTPDIPADLLTQVSRGVITISSSDEIGA